MQRDMPETVRTWQGVQHGHELLVLAGRGAALERGRRRGQAALAQGARDLQRAPAGVFVQLLHLGGGVAELPEHAEEVVGGQEGGAGAGVRPPGAVHLVGLGEHAAREELAQLGVARLVQLQLGLLLAQLGGQRAEHVPDLGVQRSGAQPHALQRARRGG
jgi:hypothetical protein